MGCQQIGRYVSPRMISRDPVMTDDKPTNSCFFGRSSDADSDVLADYVLALVSSDAPDDEIRQTSVENLEDFLRESTPGNSIALRFVYPLTRSRH